jgi:hypothetical protein
VGDIDVGGAPIPHIQPISHAGSGRSCWPGSTGQGTYERAELRLLGYSVGVHCKKRLAIFRPPAGMSLTSLSRGRNITLFPPRESLVSDIPAEDGKFETFFFAVPAWLFLTVKI